MALDNRDSFGIKGLLSLLRYEEYHLQKVWWVQFINRFHDPLQGKNRRICLMLGVRLTGYLRGVTRISIYGN